MKIIKKHLRVQLILLIVLTFLLTNCKQETETVFITPNISVNLPNNYKYFISHSTGSYRTNPELIVKNKLYNYRAIVNQDEIIMSNTITDEFDTLGLNEKKAKLKNSFTKGFVKGFNGIKLTSEEKEINGLAQSEFNFEFEKKDTLFVLYGRLIIQDTNLIFIGYKTKLPSTNRSIKNKDDFFKSIKYN